MAVKRTLIQSRWLRIALPTLVVTGLGAAAVYLGAPPTPAAEAGDLSLINTGPAVTATIATKVQGINGAPTAMATASDCPLVNGFTVTITAGSPSCAEITKAAEPYTAAVLANEPLGSSLMWSDKNWDCSRNFDDTGQIWNAHGLLCEGAKGSFVLISD